MSENSSVENPQKKSNLFKRTWEHIKNRGVRADQSKDQLANPERLDDIFAAILGSQDTTKNDEKYQKTLTEVLGTTKPGVADIRGESQRIYQRPSWEETKKQMEKFKTKAANASNEELHRAIETSLPLALHTLSHLSPESIPTLYELTYALRNQLSNRTDFADLKNDYARCTVAGNLLHSIAMSEGLFGPNDLGYVPDQSKSLANLESGIIDDVQFSHKILEQQPDLFGPQTQQIYDSLVDRLEAGRKTFQGRRVNPAPLPPFPRPQLEQKDSN